MRRALIGRAVHEFAAGRRVVGHPWHVEPAGLAGDLDLEARRVAELWILALFHVSKDPLEIFVPVAGGPRIVGRRRKLRMEVDVDLEPGAFRTLARHRRRIIAAELEHRTGPARGRSLHRVRNASSAADCASAGGERAQKPAATMRRRSEIPSSGSSSSFDSFGPALSRAERHCLMPSARVALRRNRRSH